MPLAMPSAVIVALSSACVTVIGGSPPPADPPLLRGPEVGEREPTLVRLDFDGRFVALEGRPEETAARLLLDPERAERARTLAREREEQLARLLAERVDVVREATDAIMAGDAETAERLQRSLYDAFDPMHLRDPLMPQLDPLLTDDERMAMTRLLDEYWTAWVDWELREVDAPNADTRTRIERRLVLQLFRQDLQIAYEMSLRPYRRRLEAIYEITEATPAQRAAIRSAVIDLIREAAGTPTETQLARVTERIWSALDEPQRRKLFEHALWRR